MSLKPELTTLNLNDPEAVKSLEASLRKRNAQTDEQFLKLMDEFQKIKAQMDETNPQHNLAYLGMYNAKSLCKHVATDAVNRTVEILLEKYDPMEMLGMTPYHVMEQMVKALEFQMGASVAQMQEIDKQFNEKIEEVKKQAKKEHEDA
jgi:hypothetical protein